MNNYAKAAVAGTVGAVTTNLLHELTRRLTPDAPRVDLLGMQALAHLLRGAGSDVPDRPNLYTLTLAGDLISNTAYFGLVEAVPPGAAVAAGAALGVAAGVGAVYLPPLLGLSTLPTERTAATRALTVALYSAGGLAAGLTKQRLSDA